MLCVQANMNPVCVHAHIHVQQLLVGCMSSKQWPKHSGQLLPELKPALIFKQPAASMLSNYVIHTVCHTLQASHWHFCNCDMG